MILEVSIILTWWWSTKSPSASRWRCTETSACRWPTTPSSNTTHSTTEFWFEVVPSTSLIHTSITTTTLTTISITITTIAISWGSTSLVSLIPLETTFGGLGCFAKGGWHDLRWKVKIVSEVLNSLVGQVPIVVPPCEVLTHVTTRFEGLHGLDYFQVSHFLQFVVLGEVEVLESYHDSIFEEVLVNGYTVFLRDNHFDGLLVDPPLISVTICSLIFFICPHVLCVPC